MSLRLGQAGGAGGVLAGTRRTGLAATTGGQSLGSSRKQGDGFKRVRQATLDTIALLRDDPTFERLRVNSAGAALARLGPI
jgi:hypothetical protein